MMENHIRDRIVRFHILDDKERPIYKFCADHFPKIMQDIETEKEEISDK